MPSDPSDEFHHYRIKRREDGSLWELGRGAMGVTYKAVDTNLDALVALKIINVLFLDSPGARERFVREARAAASLRHRNVATVYHLGHDAQCFFYAMEFIDGETVEAFIKHAGPLPWREALSVTRQATHALMAAYEKRLVHRDIKPANIMLVQEVGEDDRVVKLIDFGLAKSVIEEEGNEVFNTSTTGFLGTPLYASPEQCDDFAPDIRSDIYSLGITLWFMLTGQPPFVGSRGKVFKQHLDATPPWDHLPAEVPESLRALLSRVLAKERTDRPQTPADLRREIDDCLRPTVPPLAVKSVEAPAEDEDDSSVDLTVVGDAPQVGRIQGGRYHLLELVGKGASGTVFRASDGKQDGQIVAVEILHPGPWLTQDAFYQLQADIGRLRDAPHPHLIHPVCLERIRGYKYLVTEWVAGFSVADLLATQGPLPVEEALGIAAQAVEAAAHCRAHGLHKLAFGAHQILFGFSDSPDENATAAARTRRSQPPSQWSEWMVKMDSLAPRVPKGKAAGYVSSLAAFCCQLTSGESPPPAHRIEPPLIWPEAARTVLLQAARDGPAAFPNEEVFFRALLSAAGIRGRGVASHLSDPVPARPVVYPRASSGPLTPAAPATAPSAHPLTALPASSLVHPPPDRASPDTEKASPLSRKAQLPPSVPSSASVPPTILDQRDLIAPSAEQTPSLKPSTVVASPTGSEVGKSLLVGPDKLPSPTTFPAEPSWERPDIGSVVSAPSVPGSASIGSFGGRKRVGTAWHVLTVAALAAATGATAAGAAWFGWGQLTAFLKSIPVLTPLSSPARSPVPTLSPARTFPPTPPPTPDPEGAKRVQIRRLYAQARTAVMSEKWLEVVEAYTRVLTLEPNSLEALDERGSAYDLSLEAQKAKMDDAAVLRLPPTTARDHYYRADAYRALPASEKILEGQPQADYQRATQMPADDAYTYFTRGRAWTRLGKYEEAIKDYTESIRLNPQNTYAYKNRAYAYAALGKTQEAQRDRATAEKMSRP